jgi:H+/gluconate symporter-like permease
MKTILIALLVSIIIINILVSLYISRRDDLDIIQKVAQVFIVWLVPFLGAISLFIFHRNNDKQSPTSKSFGGGANDSIGIAENGGGGGD